MTDAVTHTLTDASDEEVLKLADEIKHRKTQAYMRRAEEIEKRIKEPGALFTDAELRYAATKRCKCGAGLAYPPNIGMQGSWFCSDWLTGRNNARNAGAHGEYPFVFYEIKSEIQPSANGATTRPEMAAREAQ